MLKQSGIEKIGIIGVGVLGSVVRRYFEEQGACLRLYDKYQGVGSLDEVNEADIVFICVPTPYRAGHGFDTGTVEASISSLTSPKTVLIKSTIQPGTTEEMQAKFPQHSIFFQPEFLREKTAWDDFVKPDRQIVGYCGEEREMASKLLAMLPDAPYSEVMPATSAELIKIGTNAFLALKVTYANQIYDLCSALGIDYEEVKTGLIAEPRFGSSHMNVHDSGYRGYGGKCLPKDTQGLIDLADELGSPMELLRTAQMINDHLVSMQSEIRRAA